MAAQPSLPLPVPFCPNLSDDWGNSDIGIKNRVSFRFNYELPFLASPAAG